MGHGSQGISPYFLLFNATYSNIHFAHALLDSSYAYPTEKEPVLQLIGCGRLRGFAALGGILGLLQVAVQWVCSITILTLFASCSFGVRSSNVYSSRSSTSIAATAFIHAALFLFPAMMIAFPKPSPHEFGTDLFAGFSFTVNTWVALFFVLFQFYPQYLELRRLPGHPGALSLLSLGLQAFVILAVAARWLLRLRAPTWGNQPAPLSLWYQWGALSFNYILHGIGCAILFAAYLVTGHRGGKQGLLSEEAPLLS